MSSNSYSSIGIILKRTNYRDADRIVTILTKDYGKITVLAKGVRKLSSRKKGGLEPGTISQCHFIKTHGMDLVTQVSIETSVAFGKSDLAKTTQIFQLLEIIDLLTGEGQPYPEVYEVLVMALKHINSHRMPRTEMISTIQKILELLGFGPPEDIDELGLKNYIEELANRNLKSKNFLTSSVTLLK